MPVEVALRTPLAEALQNVVQPKLVELGWSTGGLDDSALSEYIILMLVNGKTQEQIASELSNDLLGLDPDDLHGVEFARWLFDQVEQLNSQLNGASSAVAVEASADMGSAANGAHAGVATGHPHGAGQDAVMEGSPDADHRNVMYVVFFSLYHVQYLLTQSSPTGPKAMRTGTSGNREKRILGQLNKAMDRTPDNTLHRVRATQGTGRINSHSQEPPKGPRGQIGRTHRLATGRQASNPQWQNMAKGIPSHPIAAMTPQQQMQLFAMYEEQARVMAQILTPQQQGFPSPGMGGPAFNPAFQNGQQGSQGSKRSLFERVEHKPQSRGGRPQSHFNNSQGQAQHSMMNDAQESNVGAEPSSSMEVESSQQAPTDPAETMCRFNLTCTKGDCAFAHQSPAAPAGTTVDMHDICSFGAACKNRKCVGRHPSPAKRATHQAEQDCKFYPNCTNPNCPFKHPEAPPCRNGADCTTPGCTFAHSKIECRYNPCLNQLCPFKHAQGQKRGAFEDKVWTANGDPKGHVSERKFVDDAEEEELILPGSGTASSLPASADVIA